MDRPAGDRASSRTRTSAGQGEGAGSTARQVLPPHVLRQLLERAHEIDQAINRQRWQADATRRELSNTTSRRGGLQRTIDDYEDRIASSKALLAEHDRPLHRRRHRYELEGARTQLGWIPDALHRARHELAELDAREQAARHQVVAIALQAPDVQSLTGESIPIKARIEGDRRARVEQAVTDDSIAARLGKRPAFGTERELWEVAAGHLAQHHVAFGAEVRGRVSLEETAAAVSSRSTVAAIDRLEHALGRSRGAERSLGLSR